MQQLESALVISVAPTPLGFALARMGESLVDELVLGARVVRERVAGAIRQRRGRS